MEHTDRYHEPVATWHSDASIFVSAANPFLIKNFGDDSLRSPKTDKADSKKTHVILLTAILNTVSATAESLNQKMVKTDVALLEYPVVMAMNGITPTLGPQFMAKIRDVTCFTHWGTLTAFVGVAPGKNDSDQHIWKSVRTTKKGSPSLRERHSSRSWTIYFNLHIRPVSCGGLVFMLFIQSV